MVKKAKKAPSRAKKTSKKTAKSTKKAAVAPVEPIVDLDDDEETEVIVAPIVPQPKTLPEKITLDISASLSRKLADMAADEGIEVETLAAELVSEGVVLRAWEIIERKAAMRGGNSNQNQHGGGNGNFRPGGGRNGNRRGGRGNRGNNAGSGNGNGNGNGNWMEDKAAFLEYVRNQEKRRR